MTRIFSVEEMTGVRTFNGTDNGVPVTKKVAGMKLTDGKNMLYAEGFRECEVNKDGVKFYGNQVYIDTIQVLLRNSF